MKFLIDRVYLWMKRKKEREDGGIFDDLFEMLKKQNSLKYVSGSSVRGKTHYFVKEDEGRLRELTPPIIYKCKGCGYVKGLADVEAIAQGTEKVSVRYSCRVCRSILYEDLVEENVTEEVENYSQG